MNTEKLARIAGLLYLVIIVCGVGGEAFVRAPLHAEDASQTVANLLAAELPFRLSILADVAMVLADVGLGVLLFYLLAPVDRTLSMLAMAPLVSYHFRKRRERFLALVLPPKTTGTSPCVMLFRCFRWPVSLS